MIRKHSGRGKRIVYYIYAPDGHGGAEYIGKAATKDVAKQIETDAIAKRSLVEHGVLPPATIAKTTLNDLARQFFAEYKGRSERTYESRWRNRIQPVFGHRLLKEIKQADINRFRDELLTRYPASTVETTLRFFSGLLTWGRDRGLLVVNPVHGIKWPKIPERAYNWIRTKGEIAKLLAAANDEALFTILGVAVISGARQDEILHLRWDDVDFDRRRITIHRGRQGTTKGGKVRHIPILDSLLPILERWRKAKLGGGLVFPAEDGKVARNAAGLHTRYKRALARAGLDMTLRFHDLRHTFASHWVAEGGDLFKLNKILGHSSMKMTMRYAHLAPDAFDADYGRIAIDLPMGEVLAFKPGNAFTRGRVRNAAGELQPRENAYRKPHEEAKRGSDRIHSSSVPNTQTR